ncbi:MAG: DUF655 domain-containing protein [Candidatus Diapherotrites archaeon]|nr:DUF655 domain-containing protein [Candidatus Diapherotrites archaeon]
MYKEEYAVVLDYLSRGYSSSYVGEPVVQALGTSWFTLLELVPRDGVTLNLEQRVYIGPEERKEVKFIKGRLEYERLTQTGRNELPAIIDQIIKENEQKYVEFFNKARPISVRKHSLELLPSIGKKHMQAILDERDIKPFESFEDMAKRVHLLPDPVRVVRERVQHELEGEDVKYYMFTAPPRKERPEFQRRR